MATQSIKQRVNALGNVQAERELKPLLDSILTDLGVLRTAIKAVTAKLDADGGVTDTNYASTCDPAALNTLS